MRRRARQIVDAFVEHNLLTYAAAIAFQGLIALVPLSLLSLGFLGAAGRQRLWKEQLAPTLQERLTGPVFHGIDYSVRRILDHGSAGLIAVASVLSLWYLTAAMRAVMEALDTIHEVKDERSWRQRAVTAVLLGLATGACLCTAGLLALGRGGVVGWLAALVLIAVALTLVLRFAPAEQPDTRWATLGTGLIVAAWVVASILFRLWIEYVADFKSPIGTLTTLLVMTSYVFVSAVVFLAGAQLDELLRKTT